MNIPATALAGAVAGAVLVACYRAAVRWFTLKAFAAEEPAAHVNVGFPWWSLIAAMTVVATILFVWKAGYGSMRVRMKLAVGHLAQRKARELGLKAEYQRRIGAHSGRAVRYARTAVYLKDLARRLGVADDSSEAPGKPSTLAPRETAARMPDAPSGQDSANRRSVFDSIPPRVVDIPDLRGTIPPRPHPMREGSWALSHSVELTGA